MASKAGSKVDKEASDDVSLKERLKRGWELVRFLYRNEFTRWAACTLSWVHVIASLFNMRLHCISRGLGRDILFFGGSIFVIKTVIASFTEEVPPLGGQWHSFSVWELALFIVCPPFFAYVYLYSLCDYHDTCLELNINSLEKFSLSPDHLQRLDTSPDPHDNDYLYIYACVYCDNRYVIWVWGRDEMLWSGKLFTEMQGSSYSLDRISPPMSTFLEHQVYAPLTLHYRQHVCISN